MTLCAVWLASNDRYTSAMNKHQGHIYICKSTQKTEICDTHIYLYYEWYSCQNLEGFHIVTEFHYKTVCR